MISETERQRMMRAESIGPKMVDYLELIGIRVLADLRGEDPEDLAFRINAELGRAHINATGVAALGNLVRLADEE